MESRTAVQPLGRMPAWFRNIWGEGGGREREEEGGREEGGRREGEGGREEGWRKEGRREGGGVHCKW